MLSLITNERSPDHLAAFLHGMNAQGCCRGGFGLFFFFFSPSQSEYLHLFESIPLPGKIVVPTVHAYLGNGPRSRADWRGSSWKLNPWWIGSEVGATAGQSLLWLCQCLCRMDQDQQEKWSSTPWQLAPGWLALFTLCFWCGLQHGQQCVSITMDGCLSCGAIGSVFFLLGKMTALSLKNLNSIQMWDGSYLWRGQANPPSLHPIVRMMKSAGMQFRSVMSSTDQLVCCLSTHADEFIHIYSLSENF